MNRRSELRERRVRVERVPKRAVAGDITGNDARRVVRRRPISPSSSPPSSPPSDPMRLDPAEFIVGRASDERPITGQHTKPNEPLRSRVGVLSFLRSVMKSEMKAA